MTEQVQVQVQVVRGAVQNTRPYPWPWDGAIVPASLALLLVQTSDPAPKDPTLAVAASLADAVRQAGARVITLVTHAPVGPRRQHETVASVATGPGSASSVSADATIHASGWNGFFDSCLDSTLRGLGTTQLLLAGWWLEVGVHSTMRSANDMGYECLLVEDAVAAADPSLTPASLSSIEMSGGIFGAVGNSDAVLAALRALSPTPA